MYSIRKSYLQFNRQLESCIEMLDLRTSSIENIGAAEARKRYILSSGVVNNIWQAWNSYWRTYWLVNLFGGQVYHGVVGRNNFHLSNVITTGREGEVIFSFLTQTRPFSMRRFRTQEVLPHQEPTWGDLGIITNIAHSISSTAPTDSQNILSIFSTLGDTPKHIQLVRNSAIHLSVEGIKKLEVEVVPYYNIAKVKYPTDIMYAEKSSSCERAIINWAEDLSTILSFL